MFPSLRRCLEFWNDNIFYKDHVTMMDNITKKWKNCVNENSDNQAATQMEKHHAFLAFLSSILSILYLVGRTILPSPKKFKESVEPAYALNPGSVLYTFTWFHNVNILLHLIGIRHGQIISIYHLIYLFFNIIFRYNLSL